MLGRPVDDEEFRRLDDAFHEAYRQGLPSCELAADALEAMSRWTGTQSLLSMFFHDELIIEIGRRGLTGRLVRVDGLPGAVGGHRKAAYLRAHLDALGVPGESAVLIGDSVDDAEAAADVGADCVLYAGGFTDVTLLKATGLPVATSLTEAVALAQGRDPY